MEGEEGETSFSGEVKLSNRELWSRNGPSEPHMRPKDLPLHVPHSVTDSRPPPDGHGLGIVELLQLRQTLRGLAASPAAGATSLISKKE